MNSIRSFLIKYCFAIVVLTSLSMPVESRATELVFLADFDGTTVTNNGAGVYTATVDASNLNAGTATGVWTMVTAQVAPQGLRNAIGIQGAGASNVVNKALRFGIEFANFTAPLVVMEANMSTDIPTRPDRPITVSFDYADGTTDTGGDRTLDLIGMDSAGLEVFDLVFKGNASQQLGYRTSGGITFIGNTNDVNTTGSRDNSAATYDPDIMKHIQVVISKSTFDILLEGVVLTGGANIPFKNTSADSLSKLRFISNNQWTAGWFDNLQVSRTAAKGTVISLQ